MFGKRKKASGGAPDTQKPAFHPADFDPGEMAKAEKARKAARFHILFFAVVFAGLFGWMCFYFTSSAIADKVKLFDNDYNKRDELLETRIRRGNIYASDSETLLRNTSSMTFCTQTCRCQIRCGMTKRKTRMTSFIPATT